MPSLSLPNAGTLKRGLTVLSVAIGLSLTGCGSDTPTTRVSTEDPPKASPYIIFVRSPVQFKHVQYRIIRVSVVGSVADEIAKMSISDSSDQAKFEISREKIPDTSFLLLEISPTSSSAVYFDPIAKKDVAFPLNKKLRALVVYNPAGGESRTYKIDPFSELSYRRSLYRTGQLDQSAVDQPNFSLFSPQAISTSNSEIESIFQVQPTTYGLDFDEISKLKRTQQNARSFTDLLFSVGHLKNFSNQFPSATAPWFDFVDLVERDISDGDLDGMTLAGVGDNGAFSDQLADNRKLALQPVKYNTNPENNNITILVDQQKDQRLTFNTALGEVIKGHFGTIFPAASEELGFINSINYAELKTQGGTSLSSANFSLRSSGAGNFNRAFGLFGDALSKNALTADVNSTATNNNTGVVNDIEQLAGRYRNGNCVLNIGLNGRVTLTNGASTIDSSINRDLQDNLFRATNTSTDYVLNVGKPSDNTFIQLRIANVNAADKTPLRLVSATAGRSLLDQPDQLSTVDFSCTF